MEISEQDPRSVFPVPLTEREQAVSGLLPGPIMSGDVTPVHEGRYLRHFDDIDDWGWSQFVDGKWTRDGFFGSDVQRAPWRGGVFKLVASCDAGAANAQ